MGRVKDNGKTRVRDAVRGDKFFITAKNGKELFMYVGDFFNSPYIIDILNSLVTGSGPGQKNSIELDSGDIQLVGDALTPGNGKYYGTDGSGVKGFHSLTTGSPSAGSAGDLQFSDGSGGFQTNNIEAFGTVFMPTVNLGMNLGSATRRWLSIVAREHLADSGRGGNVGYSWTGIPNDAINNGSGTGGGIGIKTRSAEKVKVSNQNSTTTGIVLIQDGIPATSNAVVSALLELKSTTKGFLPPRMTTVQMNAIASPATGLIIYDTTTNQWMGYNGTSWVILG